MRIRIQNGCNEVREGQQSIGLALRVTRGGESHEAFGVGFWSSVEVGAGVSLADVTMDWVADTRDSYDRVAQPYADFTCGADTANAYMIGTYGMLAGLCRNDRAPSRPAVADIGCGPGMWVHLLATLGVEVIGIDLSPRMIDLARARSSDARFEVGSIHDLPLPTEGFDGAACMYVLHHVPDDAIDAALDELVRVVRPGGVLLLGGHIGDKRRVKTEGYGGHPMHVLSLRRPATLWEAKLRERGMNIEAHTIYDPDEDMSTHALFARKPAPQPN